MKNFFARLKNRSGRGDTLVEVLVSIAIITMVVAIGYTVANRSLQNGTSADQRDRALSLAQGQVEQLVNAVNIDNLDTYKKDKPFCIGNDGQPTDANSSGVCPSFQGQPFGVGVTYDKTSSTFTIKAQWSQANGNNSSAGSEGQLTLYYKAPGVFIGTDYCPNFDGIQQSVPNGYTVKNGQCVSIATGQATPLPETHESGSPPECHIWSANPGPNNTVSVNGDCSGGHNGGSSNIVVNCDPSGCFCTVSVVDWNFSGSGAAISHVNKCPGQQPPGGVWPPGADASQLPDNPCTPPMVGELGKCIRAPFCPVGTQGSASDPSSNCQPIPDTDLSTGITQTGGCIPYISNNFCINPPTSSGGGSGNTSSGGTGNGNTGNGNTGNGNTGNGGGCITGCSNASGGGGVLGGASSGNSGGGCAAGCCGINNHGFTIMPNFGVLSWFHWLLPHHHIFAMIC